MGVDDIAHIPQHHGGPLLDALRGSQVQFSTFFHDSLCLPGAGGVLDFVASDIGKADWGADMDAVDNAESDLRSVTEMMSTDHQETGYDTMVVETDATMDDDPWTSLVMLMTATELDLLRSLLHGKGTSMDVRTVESINAKAVDTVGDTVIDDGSVVDDYREDLGRVLEG